MEPSKTTFLLLTLGNVALIGVIVAIGIALSRWFVRSAKRAAAQRHEHEIAELASSLVHEARNLLNGMRAQLSLLRRRVTSDPEKCARHLESIEKAIGELNALFESFLTFSRPVDNDPVPLDPVALVQEVLDYVALDLAQANIELQRDFAPIVPMVYADPGRLRRAILNLIVNARQAMDSGGRLTVRVKPAQRGMIAIEVEDTGPGIPEELLERVFQPFFTTKPGGSGLGLALVKRTIEELDGTVEVESSPGQGTRFRILLPKHRSLSFRRRAPAKATREV